MSQTQSAKSAKVNPFICRHKEDESDSSSSSERKRKYVDSNAEKRSLKRSASTASDHAVDLLPPRHPPLHHHLRLPQGTPRAIQIVIFNKVEFETGRGVSN
jgi:hypothetical protein